MNWAWVLCGAGVLAVAVVDIVWSTLTAAGGGPLARRLSRAVWRAAGRSAVGGPAALVATAALWVGLLWAGWTLVFMGGDGAVVTASGDVPAGLWGRVYFAGYTVVTLGLGDLVPSGPGWRVLTVVAAATGLVFITLGVTYYTAVLSAVVHKRQLAALLKALGDGPADTVAGAWDGDGFSGLGSALTTLADHLATHGRQHHAYPVLHYYRDRRPEDALAVQLARFYDAVVLWSEVVAPDHRPPPGPLRLARGALDGLIETLEAFVEAPAEAPPPPDVGPLRAAGVPLVDDPAAAFRRPAVADRRRILRGLVRDVGLS